MTTTTIDTTEQTGLDEAARERLAAGVASAATGKAVRAAVRVELQRLNVLQLEKRDAAKRLEKRARAALAEADRAAAESKALIAFIARDEAVRAGGPHAE